VSKSDRTEQATPKRRRDARRKGQVARSVELPQALSLLAVVFTLPMVLPRLGDTLMTDWQLATARAATAGPDEATALLGHFLFDVFKALLPLVLAVMAAGVAAGVAMSGGRPNAALLKPRFEKISPKAGIKRLASKQTLWELAKTALKMALVAAVAVGAWQAGLADVMSASGSLDGSIDAVTASISGMVRRVALLGLLVGTADAVVAHRRHRSSLRMTKQEVKEEMKQSEGDPHVKAAIRGRQAKLSRSRMMAAVAGADVILTNPTHLAIALAYEPGSGAPTVVAKGADRMAERIRAEATAHGIPLMENKPLARALYRTVEVGDEIPAAFYRAVAEILALVYRTRARRAA
jgi:flagellar biosynthesis protein FlhB